MEWRNNEHIDPSHAVDNRHDTERHTTPGAAPTHTHWALQFCRYHTGNGADAGMTLKRKSRRSLYTSGVIENKKSFRAGPKCNDRICYEENENKRVIRGN